MGKTRTRTKSAKARMHGLYFMNRSLQELGSRAIDPASDVGRALAEWKNSLIADLGGTAVVNTAQLQIIEMLATDKLKLDSIDAYILDLGEGIVNKRHRKLYPIVEQRGKIADRIQRQLTALLGLGSRTKSTHLLDTYKAANQ